MSTINDNIKGGLEAVLTYCESKYGQSMIFKGSLGTGGTITSLPTATSANTGFTYKVITAGTYEGNAAKIGDIFISNGTEWVYIPSGDEPSGTVTNIATGTGLTTASGSAITSTGTIQHADIETTSAISTSALKKITTDGIGHIKTTANVTESDLPIASATFSVSAAGVVSYTES